MMVVDRDPSVVTNVLAAVVSNLVSKLGIVIVVSRCVLRLLHVHCRII